MLYSEKSGAIKNPRKSMELSGLHKSGNKFPIELSLAEKAVEQRPVSVIYNKSIN